MEKKPVQPPKMPKKPMPMPPKPHKPMRPMPPMPHEPHPPMMPHKPMRPMQPHLPCDPHWLSHMYRQLKICHRYELQMLKWYMRFCESHHHRYFMPRHRWHHGCNPPIPHESCHSRESSSCYKGDYWRRKESCSRYDWDSSCQCT